MGAFILSLLIGALGIVAAVVLLRYGLILAGWADRYISAMLQASYQGFNWYWRIPFRIGMITEYLFFLLIGQRNYFKPNWWPLKLTGYLTFFLFVALLLHRQGVYHYYTHLWNDGTLFPIQSTGAGLSWYLLILTTLWVSVVTLVLIESIRMHFFLAPFRIALYLSLSLVFGALSLFTLVILLFYPVMFLVSLITGANPFAIVREGYHLFHDSLSSYQEKRQFFRQQQRKLRPKHRLKSNQPIRSGHQGSV